MRLTSAEEAWDMLMTKVYGALLADEGKPAAERHFSKNRCNKNKCGECGRDPIGLPKNTSQIRGMHSNDCHIEQLVA